jgi:hypothetical protein
VASRCSAYILLVNGASSNARQHAARRGNSESLSPIKICALFGLFASQGSADVKGKATT